MTLSQKGTVRRLLCYGLDKSSAVEVVRHIQTLLDTNGAEWTVSRLKTMKVAFIQKLAHKDPNWSWIKVRSGIPTGPLRSIFRLRKPHKVLNCLMVYSSLVSHSVTKKQWSKFYNSVVFVRKNDLQLFRNFVDIPRTKFGKGIEFPFTGVDAIINQFFSNVRSPDMYKDFKTEKSSPKLILAQFNHLIAREFINKNLQGQLPKEIMDQIEQQWSSIHYVLPALNHQDVVGRISFLQEPGYKLRAIANPLPCFQILLDPLKRSILKILGNIPNDFTMDQDKGVSTIQGFLRSGTSVSSIDLADATNYLPLSDQINVLTSIYGHNEYVKLFRRVSMAKWACSTPDGETTIQWSTGQPLGLGPSFPSFALYHHFVVRMAICNVEGSITPLIHLYEDIFGRPNKIMYKYAIVGDDIVIDHKYADEYMRLIEALECKISLDKCIFDSDTAEFCSRLITKNKVIRQFKWKLPTDQSYISMAKQFGPNILPLMRPKQRKILQLIGEIPDTLNGPVGWNPYGKPLMQREAELWQVAEALEHLSDELDTSKPRREIHYLLKRELGLISFDSYSLNDMVNNPPKEASSVDPRQSFANEMIWRRANAPESSIAVAAHSAISLAGGETTLYARLSEEERKILDFVIEPSSKPLRWEDPSVTKLYSLVERYASK